MSTTVTYKGATLTTAENQTRVLKTAGKVMEDDVTIVDVTSGGGSGLEYETGLHLGGGSVPTIAFSNTHSSPPMFVLITLDTPPFDSTLSTVHMWLYADWNTYYDVDIMPSSSTSYQARIQYMYRNTSTTALSSGVLNLTSTTMSDYVTSTGFTPTAASGVSYRSGGRYNWIAVWPPT